VAWSVVLLQGLLLFPISVRVSMPNWWNERVPNWNSLVPQWEQYADLSKAIPVIASAVRVESEFATKSVPATSEFGSLVDDAERSNDSAGSLAIKQLGGNYLGDTSTRTSDSPLDPSRSFEANPMISRSNVSPSEKFVFGTKIFAKTIGSIAYVDRRSFEVILLLVWGLGLLVAVGLLMVNYWLLNVSLSQCRPARRAWAEELQKLCLELGLERHVQLDVHQSLGPFLCWTPRGQRIVVPVRLWNRLSSAERLAVLHHELCHLRRGDLWKAIVARLVVSIHWFNPFAWLAAKRFDESAEWSCDTMLAREAPSRVTQLAGALLVAAQSQQNSPMVALSATGGPLFQRVRRLVAWNHQGDTLMQKGIWIGVLLVLVLIGNLRIHFHSSVAQAADEVSAPPINTSVAESDKSDSPYSDLRSSTQLSDIASRIMVDDKGILKEFVKVLQSPIGKIIMADRAALQAQNSVDSTESESQWEQFRTKFFDQSGKNWSVKPAYALPMQEYVESVRVAEKELTAIATAFLETATGMETKDDASEGSKVASMLKRFLQHPAAPAFIYHDELRSKLHPNVTDLAEQFQEFLVRSPKGVFVVRPARRMTTESRLATFDGMEGPLGRLEKELSAWSEDLYKRDPLHESFAATLALPEFAKYVIFEQISEDGQLRENELEYIFDQLEEATVDTASGLKIELENDNYKELQEMMDRFQVVWNYREALREPLVQLAEEVESQDDLHARLKAFLMTDMALFFIAEEMDYLPVEADVAVKQWLSQIVTKNAAGKFEVTAESTEDLQNRIDEFYRESRDVRRRGRLMDDFASLVSNQEVRTVMETITGKLILSELIQKSIDRPHVDGLQLWFDEFFEETPDGLVLHDWAVTNIEEVIAEAKALEKELVKSDF